MKKLLLVLCTLLAGVSGVKAETYTITFDHRTGTFYKSGTVATGWVNQWKSNEAGKPVVTLTASANNINTDNGRMAPGSSQSSTYSLSVENGYIVTGFSMDCPTSGAEVTVTPAGESAVVVATGGTLVVNSSASSFVYSGSNSGRIQASAGDGGSFTITVENDPSYVDWTPSFGTGSTIIVGDKVESINAASAANDNNNWYILTQVRNGESALYDDGSKLMRGSTAITAASFQGAMVEGNTAYLVRFISTGTDDIYQIQLGNGHYVAGYSGTPGNGTALSTTSSQSNAGSFAFYNSNGGSGSYFGWNLASKTGKRVDNNGAGNPLSFWGEGSVSGTSGNNVWYVYPATINTPASTVEVTYNFVVNSSIVNSETVTVGANTEINIPSTLTTGYSANYYNFITTGTIGDENCTITVTAELKDATVVYPYTAISNNKAYYIYTINQARGGLSTYTADGNTYLASSVKSGLSLSPKKFAIITYNDNYYLYSVEDAKFVTFSGSEATVASLETTITGTSDRITFSQTNAPLYEIKFDGSNSKIFNSTNSSSYPYGIVINSWGSSQSQWDDGCQYTIHEAEDFDPTNALAALDAYFNPSATVTYVISDATGVVYTSEAQPATVGATITELPAELQRPYCTYVVTSATMAAGSNTVNATVTYTLPFTVSANFTDATWYYATIRGSKYLRADESAKDGSGRYQTNTTNEKTDAYKWAFVGNPYNLSIINKAHEGKVLYAGDVPVMQEATPATDVKARWIVSSNSNGGFSVRSESGANLYINDAGNAGNLGYWNSSWGANDTGSNWTVAEVPAATVDVTYNLVVGGETVNTIVDEQVAANSDINIPASLTSGYSTLAYDFVTSGSIGTENTTITVTGTLKAGVITALSQLSNAKAYTLNTVRGSLGTDGTQMVSTNGTSYSASNFAIISYEDNYYLYSVADSKWVGNPTTINSVVNQPALTEDLSSVTAIAFDDALATAASPLFFMGMGSNGVNVSNYSTGIVVNDWTTRDDGNQYCIIEAADFDATNALAALEEYFHPAAEAQFNDAIAALQAINFGNGLGQYGLTGEYAVYTTLANDIVDGLEAQGYTADNLAMAQAMLANYALNMPTAGFYRIKGKTSGKYLAAGMASNNKFNMTDAEDLTTIFYFDGTKLVNASSGLYDGMTASAWAWVASDAASTVEFQDGLTNGGYGIKSATCNFYDNGDNTSSADRGNSVTITTSTNARYTSWALEEASAFTLNLNDAGDGKYYATLCVPFDAILNGATAYTMAVDGNYLAPTEVATIAAGTPVLVKSENIGAVVTLSDNYAAAPSTETALTGTYVEKTIDGTTDYVLGKNADAVGFYHWDSNTLAANRAYVAAETGYSVKGFAINWAGDADGIKAIENANNNDVIYNLAGQRVTKAVRGIYVKNGKKVVVK